MSTAHLVGTVVSCLVLASAALPVRAAAQQRGVVQVQALDLATRAPLEGAAVRVVEVGLSASTGADGRAVFGDLAVGSYTLEIQREGHRPQLRSDVIVKSGQTTPVVLELSPAEAGKVIRREEAVTITPSFFPEADYQPLGLVAFSSESVRRAAASAGDVSRFIAGLPSVAKVNDSDNSLIVRGGSPMENGFYLDNIEIPNVNHFPAQGSSGGPIGLVNVDLLQDVSFHTGAFAPRFGDRLSSVLELRLREGNRDRFGVKADLSFAGAGLVGEGPLGRRGSWLLSARRSFIDLLAGAIGSSTVPQYSDYQGKVVYELGTHHRLSALGILGLDELDAEREDREEDGLPAYGSFRSREGAGGLNWQWLWSGRGYSDTSISYDGQRFREEFFETRSASQLSRNRSLESAWCLRHVSHARVADWLQTEFGVDGKRRSVEYDNWFDEYTDALGQTIPTLALTTRHDAWQAGAHASVSLKPFAWLTTTVGARGDYSSASERTTVDPRASAALRFGPSTTLSLAAGRFHQPLPLILLEQHDANRSLADPQALHLVAGLSQLLGKDVRLTIEAYDKRYRHFPMDPSQPRLFVIDEPYDRFGFFFNHERLVDDGEARARGVELLLERRASRGLYGAVNGAFFRTQYRGLDGVWRDRIFDNRYLVGVEGGWKPNRAWEFSLRWNYGGGVPTTPFDEEASRSLGRGVYDESRINATRLPAYHSLNVRIDRRFHFKRSNLIVYVSVWNAYGRENVAEPYWNEIENRADRTLQWGTLPIFGIQYEF